MWNIHYMIGMKSESALVVKTVKELGQFSIKLMRVGAITEASEGRTDCTEVRWMPPVRWRVLPGSKPSLRRGENGNFEHKYDTNTQTNTEDVQILQR